MKKLILFTIVLVLSFNSYGQDYNFSGTMTREKLELYLSRAITMQGLTDEISCYFPPCSPSSTNVYNPIAHNTSVKMLADINARFIGRACGLWGGEWMINYGYFNNVATMVHNINSEYLQKGLVKPIIQAGMFEFVSNQVNGIQMSNTVSAAYNEPLRNFNFDAMKYNDFPSNSNHQTIWGNQNEIVPDISKKETQMWFYFLATNYIDKGIEALHFGQAEIMDDNDPNHVHYWNLLQKIRSYAAAKNRGVVLCDAHTKGLYYSQTEQLLFDLHSYPLRIQEVNGTSWGDGTGGAAKIDYNYCGAIYGQSKGGKTFFGWSCTSLPYLVEFDNYGISSNPNQTGSTCFPWGWDEITWFGLQTENYRNNWLKYGYYKVKCLDHNAYLQMPGIRGMTENGVPWPGHIYRAVTGYYNQQETIKSIWNNSFLSPSNWIDYNFTNEEVINQPSNPHVNSSLIFGGTDRMYYIATDGYIHGYIKDNGVTGVWSTVSPSYAAQIFNNQNVSNQVKAKSDLTISPDGNTILYIGIDGYVHGFNVNNVWNYTYFDFVKQPMINQNLKADKNLIFTSNTRVYYVAKENNGMGNSIVHGFIKYNGNWTTVSPTYASQVSSNNMVQVGGALTHNPSNNRLYYVGTDGFLYYYTINNDWSYTYNIVPNTQLLNQNLRIIPNKLGINNNRIYYIGKELTNNNALRIHCLIDNGSSWSTVSPSWSAHTYNSQNINSQVQANGNEIAVSPNGQMISYIGIDNKVHYYKDINSGWNYSWNSTYGSNNLPASNSLQFVDNNTLFYNSTGDIKVHYVKFQESYCQNPSINVIESAFVYAKRTKETPPTRNLVNLQNQYALKDSLFLKNDMGNKIKIYPNPASSIIQIEMSSESLEDVYFEVIDQSARIVKSGKINSITTQLFIGDLANGLYLIILKKQNGTTYKQKIILTK
jgi:hypothetical protein